MLKKIKILLLSVGVFILLTLIPVVTFRFIQVDTTSYMLIRQKQYEEEGKPTDYKHQYISISKMPRSMIEAVITVEDNMFLEHNGFNYGGIAMAWEHNKSGKRPLRGGSSITQQLVKNVFLWPDRTWTRKAMEAYFTVLVNAVWSKEYQMEVYLNSIEFGENVYGIEAAAKEYFGVSASELTDDQCVLLATILAGSCKWSPVNPSEEVLSLQKTHKEKLENYRNKSCFEGLEDWKRRPIASLN